MHRTQKICTEPGTKKKNPNFDFLFCCYSLTLCDNQKINLLIITLRSRNIAS